MTVGANLDSAKILRLLDVARKLSAPIDLDVLLTSVIDAGRDVLGADRGTVFLYDDKSRELYMKVATGLKQLRFSIDRGIAGECARYRKIINVPDCYADSRFNQDIDRQTGYKTNCLIAVPLIGLEDQLVGVLQLLNAAKGRFDEDDERIAEVLASQAAVAVQRAVLIDERIVKLKLENDILVAKEIQQNVLPHELPAIDGYDIAVFNRPADETGGDIYDIARRPDHVGDPAAPLLIMLGDATGHGIGPALSVTQARAMFRIGLRLGADLAHLIEQIDRQLEEDLSASRFITAFFGELNPKTNAIWYNAPGQGPLIQYHAKDQSIESRGATNVPLGIMPGMLPEDNSPFVMEPGDFFILLTDGFFEAIDENETEFGDERVAAVIRKHAAGSSSELIAAFVAALDAWRGRGPQIDDWTAVVVKRNQ